VTDIPDTIYGQLDIVRYDNLVSGDDLGKFLKNKLVNNNCLQIDTYLIKIFNDVIINSV